MPVIPMNIGIIRHLIAENATFDTLHCSGSGDFANIAFLARIEEVCGQIPKQVRDDDLIIELPTSKRHAELVSASHRGGMLPSTRNAAQGAAR